MQQLTDAGRQIVADVAQRHGFSIDAVTTMLSAVSAGYGNQAQFNHPEFGGMGQWSSGGMVMIGDMFNNYLKGRVSSLCQELSTLIQGQPLFGMPAQVQSQSQGGGWQQQPSGQQQSQGGGSGSSLFVPSASSGNWWPADLGMAGSLGSQNNLRYAYFPNARRLAIDVNGQVSVYDTGDHQIGGFSQQQSGDQSLTFTSQFGLVRVADLPLISGGSGGSAPVSSFNAPQASGGNFQSAPPVQQWTPPPPMAAPINPPSNAPVQPQAAAPISQSPKLPFDEIFALIEKLADLHTKGILTDAEYETKKQDMLSRL